MNKRTKLNEAPIEPICVSLDETDGTNKFDQAFAEAVCEGLESISDTVAPVLRIYLDDAMALEIGLMKSRMSAENARPLEKGLEKIFGFGARVFEKRILENLYAKLAFEDEIAQDFIFSRSVEQARQKYESKMRVRQRAKNDGCDPKVRSRST